MFSLTLNKYNTIISNQINLKILSIKHNKKFFIKKITGKFFFNGIDSFKNLQIIESFYFFRMITLEKCYISFLKKKYKEYDIIVKLNLLKKKINNILILWFLFYFPLLHKRESNVKLKIDKKGLLTFSTIFYNIYPFFSSIFFSWFKVTNYFIIFSDNDNKFNLLICYYYNFPFKKK